MYLPTFWKLTQEVYFFKFAKVAGWGLPAGAMSKSSSHSSALNASSEAQYCFSMRRQLMRG